MWNINKIFIGILLMGLSSGCDRTKEKPKEIKYSPKIVTEQSGATSWIFTSNEPPLDLDNEENFIRDINVALKAAELPEIDSWETEKINKGDLLMKRHKPSRIYEWTDYPLGNLKIKRGYNRTGNTIWKITLDKKEN